MRTGRFMLAAAIAALALPAAAGSWPNLPASKPAVAKPRLSLTAVPPQSRDGFVDEAGDAVSSLEQYRYFPTEEYRGKATIAYAKPAGASCVGRLVSSVTATGPRATLQRRCSSAASGTLESPLFRHIQQ